MSSNFTSERLIQVTQPEHSRSLNMAVQPTLVWYTAVVRIKAIALCILVLLLQACAAATQGSPTPVETVVTNQSPPTRSGFSPNASPSPSVTSSPTPPPSSPTPTLAACLLAGGRVWVYDITIDLLRDPLVYRVYLPPCYDEQPERTYPVLYLIHGMYADDSQWDKVGVPETADRLISSGEVAPFIVVMPRDRVWVEPLGDNFGKAVAETLVPLIDAQYRTIPDREHRAIGGLSRGGAWAVDIGLSHPELFSRVGVHSGFVFNCDLVLLLQWVKNTPQAMLPDLYIDLGDKDYPSVSTGSAWLKDFLTQNNISYEWHIFSGEHEEAYWKAHVEDYLRWYTTEWGN